MNTFQTWALAIIDVAFSLTFSDDGGRLEVRKRLGVGSYSLAFTRCGISWEPSVIVHTNPSKHTT